MVPVRSAQRGGAFLDSTRERPQPNRILCAGRGGVALELGGQLAELLQDGGGAIVAPRTQPVNALEGGRDRTGTVRLDSLAAHELVEIRARDHDARRPGDSRLLLRVELARVDEQGGVSVFDFTESSNAHEIAYFDRGPLDANKLVTAGYWSTYWYNGYIYGSEIARGIDIFRLKPSEFLSQNELDAALLVKFDEFNAQEQPKFIWPNEFVVAKAYLDQLGRKKVLAADRIAALVAAMDRAEKQTGASRKTALDQLEPLVSQLEQDAATAKPRDARTLRAAVGVIKAKSQSLR